MAATGSPVRVIIERPAPRAPAATNGSGPSSDPIIIIDVGGRKSSVLRATLFESPSLARELKHGWAHVQEDGSIFIDSDPDVFEHLLEYMRRPKTFPLFWSRANSFDYALYSRLQAEADNYGIKKLRDWIANKEYTKAVHVRVGAPKEKVLALGTPETVVSTESTEFIEGFTPNCCDISVDTHVVTKKLVRFRCPRGKKEHEVIQGDELLCEPACCDELGILKKRWVEEAESTLVMVAKYTLFDPSVLKADEYEVVE